MIVCAARGWMYEGQSAIIKARITTDEGLPVSSDGATAATVAATSVTIKVLDQRTSPATVLNTTTTLAVGTAFTAEATGYLTTGWTQDATGYNFCAVIPDGDGSGFNVAWEGGHTYSVEITVATAATIDPGAQSEGPITFRVEMKVEPMLGVT